MKKKQITLLTCSVIAVTLASVYLTNKETDVNESDNLLALNIEALSFGDENGEIGGLSDCPGLALYSNVGKIDGRATLRFHINDTTDQLVTQTYKKCYAKGIGKTQGNDVSFFDVFTESISEDKCLGEFYHKSSLYEY